MCSIPSNVSSSPSLTNRRMIPNPTSAAVPPCPFRLQTTNLTTDLSALALRTAFLTQRSLRTRSGEKTKPLCLYLASIPRPPSCKTNTVHTFTSTFFACLHTLFSLSFSVFSAPSALKILTKATKRTSTPAPSHHAGVRAPWPAACTPHLRSAPVSPPLPRFPFLPGRKAE